MEQKQQSNQFKEEPNNGSGLGCFLAVILGIFSLLMPVLIIFLLNLSGLGLRYDPLTYFGVCICVGLSTMMIIFLDVNKKVKTNENSDKSNK